MPLQPGGRAPYTTSVALVTALDAWRERGLGTPVTADVLTRAGVQESLARRTFQSLVDLELLSEDGTPTEQFQAFRSARGDDEYRSRLQEWLRSVYADVLMYTDPSTSSYDGVAEAFRTYEPAGQRRAMASLLLGLWKYAGLPINGDNNGDSRSRRPASRRPTRAKESYARVVKTNPPPAPTRAPELGLDGLPPGLVGLLHQIPRDRGSWTTDRRDGFLRAFQAVLDFSVPVDDNPPPVAEENDKREVDS